jgi:hypothetical protein
VRGFRDDVLNKFDRICLLGARFTIASLGLLCLLTVLKKPLNFDAGFYLSVARRMADGLSPYADLSISYTPLAMYLYEVVFLLTRSDWSISLCFLLQMLALLWSALLFRKLLLRLELEPNLVLLLTAQYGLLAFYLTGDRILLEPILLPFLMLSLLAAQSEAWILAGCAVAVAFGAKQYGLAGLAPVLVVGLACPSKEPVSRVFLRVLAGFLLVLTLATLVLVFCEGESLSLMLGKLFNVGYARQSAAWTEKPLLAVMILYAAYSVAAVWNRNEETRYWLVVSLVGLAGFAVSLLVRQYRHYFLLLLPYFTLLLSLAWSELASHRRAPLALLPMIGLFSFTLAACLHRTGSLVGSQGRRYQLEIGRQVQAVIGPRRPGVVFGPQPLVFTCNLDPQIDGKGYNFLDNIPENKLMDHAVKQQVIIVYKPAAWPLTPDEDHLRASGFVVRLETEKIKVWEKTKA